MTQDAKPLKTRMRAWCETWKPAASGRTHALLGAMMWTGVGVFLIVRGGLILAPKGWGLATDLVLAVAALLGLAKGRFVLDKTAGRSVDRIRQRGDGRCVLGFQSVKNWGLVLAMIVFGRLLRMSPLPVLLVGGIYALVGMALLFSSRVFWQAWRALR